MPLAAKEGGKPSSLLILWRRRTCTLVNSPVKGSVLKILASHEAWVLIAPIQGN